MKWTEVKINSIVPSMASLLQFSEIIDISPMISSKIAVFPGDKSFEENFSMNISSGDNLSLSAIHTTVHLGAHTDAPSHYHQSGDSIEKRKLSFYIGPVQIIEVLVQPGSCIRPEHLQNKKIQAERVLFKTGSFPNPDQWNSDFVALSPELIEYLNKLGVILVGLDTPSVDLAEDKVLLAHQKIYEKNMAILEGVMLDQVPEGVYQLIALPLKIKGADATPVRAVLLR